MSLTSQLITVKNIFYKGISGFIQCLDFLGKMSGFFLKNVWIYPDVVWIFSEKLWGPMVYALMKVIYVNQEKDRDRKSVV